MSRQWKTRLAIGILIAGLGALIYVLLLPGFATPYLAVDQLLARQAEVTGKTVRLAGYLAGRPQAQPDGRTLLRLQARGQELAVVYDGALPANLDPGKEILLDGRLAADGSFKAERLYTRCSTREQEKLRDGAAER